MTEENYIDIIEMKETFGYDLAYEIIINWEKMILT